MFGQDEEYYEEPVYEEPYTEVIYYGVEEAPVEEIPSETRYVETYQAQQEAIQAKVESGSGFFDIFKSIIGIATPVVTSAMKAGQPTITTLPKTSIGLPVSTASLAGLTSSPLLLIGLGLGGFLLLRGRRKRGRK